MKDHLEQIFGPDSGGLATQVHRQNSDYARKLMDRLTRPLPTAEPWEWIVANVILKTPVVSGRFNPIGREYMREPINDINDFEVPEQSCCWGAGNGKSLKNVAQCLWAFEHDPFSALYIMPTRDGEGGAKEFNNGTLMPTVKATECFKEKIPTGNDRHNFSGLKLKFAGNNLGLVGANSPTQLGAKRCRIIWLDEQDKYKDKLGREEGADYLASERTKQVANRKIIRSSTPTKDGSGIWPHLMRSDLRRRFLPCPHCNPEAVATNPGWFLLVKDHQFTVLPSKFADGKVIAMAEMKWDKEAKRKDGTWDEDRIVRSTRFECPHCGGHVMDHHRTWLDKLGVWTPTQLATMHRGYHLPSFYAPHVDFESSWGGMARKFLRNFLAGKSQGYINSDLAEVHSFQEISSVTIGSSSFAQQDWIALMTVDFQKLWPYLWFVVEKFSTFKLQPPLNFKDGKPEFVEHLDANPALKVKIEKLVDGNDSAWPALSEVLRFDPCTGEFPPLDWLIAKGITGEKLTHLFEVTCGHKTLDFGNYIFREMGQRLPKGGDGEIIAAGHCELSGDDAWAELKEIQQQFHVGEQFSKNGISPNRAVLIDSGYMESHNPEVLRKCFESGEGGRWQWFEPKSKTYSQYKTHIGCLPAPMDCWVPFKGYPVRKRWRTEGKELATHWGCDDPFKGLAEADKFSVELLEAAAEWYFHKWMDDRDRQPGILKAIKERRPYRGNLWSVAGSVELFGKMCNRREDFERQMNAKGRNSDGEIWERGSGGGGKRAHPDHLNDCCRNMYPLAEAHGFFSHETNQ